MSSPFAKIVGVIAAIAAIFTAADHAALVTLFGSEAIVTAITAVCTLIVAFSHSLNGTGGTTSTAQAIKGVDSGVATNLTTR